MSKGTKQVRAGKLLALAAEWERTAERVLGLDKPYYDSTTDSIMASTMQQLAKELREAIDGRGE